MKGGARPGAGRKRGPEGLRVTFTCKVLPSTRERIKELKKQGVYIGELMDKWVREYDTAKFIRDFEKEFGD